MKHFNEIGRRFLLYLVTLIIFTIVFVGIGSDPEEWNGISPEDDDTLLKKVFNRFYFTTITFSTIGYGDISPKSMKLKSTTILLALCMILELFTILYQTKWNTK